MTSGVVMGPASLIAPEAKTEWYEGAGIVESVMSAANAMEKGDWLGTGANGLVTGLSTLGTITDPLQAGLAAGVGWAMEHLEFLREPLDWLAGDPKEIEGHANTWTNVQKHLYTAADSFATDVAGCTAEWESLAVPVYQLRAREQAQHVHALAEAAGVLSAATLRAGAMVGIVRNTIRDIIAELVGAVLSKALQALTVALIPKVVAEISIMAAECAMRVLKFLKELVACIRQLCHLLSAIEPALTRVASGVSKLDGPIDAAAANVKTLGGFRLRAAADAQTLAPLTFRQKVRSAYDTVSEGHAAVYGKMPDLAAETSKTATRNNGIQNSAAYKNQLEENDEPPPRELPL